MIISVFLVFLFLSCGEDKTTGVEINPLLIGTWIQYEKPDMQGNKIGIYTIDGSGDYEYNFYVNGTLYPKAANDHKGTINHTNCIMSSIRTHQTDTNGKWVPYEYNLKIMGLSYLSNTIMLERGAAFIREGSGSGMDGGWLSRSLVFSNDILIIEDSDKFIISGTNAILVHYYTNRISGDETSSMSEFDINELTENRYEFIKKVNGYTNEYIIDGNVLYEINKAYYKQ